ncbi:hypothetical protein D3C76_1233500 [compost metagenome]
MREAATDCEVGEFLNVTKSLPKRLSSAFVSHTALTGVCSILTSTFAPTETPLPARAENRALVKALGVGSDLGGVASEGWPEPDCPAEGASFDGSNVSFR